MSIQTQPHQILSGLVLVCPQIDIWGGTVSFDPRSQLSVTAREELPPQQLASNGRLHLIPTGSHRNGGPASPLATLTSKRKAVARRIRNTGFPFLGGMAIPQNIADEVLKDLALIEGEFQTAVDDFLLELPELFAQRQKEYPMWAEVLKKHQPEPTSLRDRFRFHVHMYAIGVPGSPEAAAHCQTTALKALPALLAEIAIGAAEMLEKSFSNRTVEVTQKAVNPVRQLIAKLDAFSFVDPQVAPLVAVLNDHMRTIPRNGPLNAEQEKQLVVGLTMMANPQHLLAFGAQQAATPAAIPAAHQPQAPSTPVVPLVLPVTPVQPANVFPLIQPAPVRTQPHVIPTPASIAVFPTRTVVAI